MLDRLLTSTHSFSRILVWIGGGLILGSAFLVTGEVFMRKLFNVSIGGADELSGYAFGIATTLGLAFALFERSHIRVDALYSLFSIRLKVVASLFGLALLIGFASVITWTAWSMVGDTLHHGSRSITPMRTPLAWPQIPWLFGWLFFIFSGTLIFFAASRAVFQKDLAKADTLIGMKSVEQQIEDESV